MAPCWKLSRKSIPYVSPLSPPQLHFHERHCTDKERAIIMIMANENIKAIDHYITYSIISSTPALSYSSVVSTVRCYPVTSGSAEGQTFVTWSANFSSDADAGMFVFDSFVLSVFGHPYPSKLPVPAPQLLPHPIRPPFLCLTAQLTPHRCHRRRPFQAQRGLGGSSCQSGREEIVQLW